MSYRYSHLEKGKNYDDKLTEVLMENYNIKMEAKILTKLIPSLFPNGVNRFLDFAGGTGRITKLIEPFVLESIAIDVSESMLAVAKKKCKRTKFILADITKVPMNLEPFDLVTAFRFFGNRDRYERLVPGDFSSMIQLF